MSSKASRSTYSWRLANLDFQDPDSRIEAELSAAPHPIFILETILYSLHPDELSLVRIQYEVPSEYKLELSEPNNRACAPPPGRFYLYIEALRIGPRLPISPFVLAFFYFMDIFLASMVPNFFRFIIGFLFLYISAKFCLTTSFFRNYCTFKHHPIAKD